MVLNIDIRGTVLSSLLLSYSKKNLDHLYIKVDKLHCISVHNPRKSYLTNTVLISKAYNHTVLWCIVFIFCLSGKMLTSLIISLTL